MCCRSEWQERMYIYKWHEVDQTKHEIFCSYCLQWNTSQSKFRNHYLLFLFAFSILSQLFLIWGCIWNLFEKHLICKQYALNQRKVLYNLHIFEQSGQTLLPVPHGHRLMSGVTHCQWTQFVSINKNQPLRCESTQTSWYCERMSFMTGQIWWVFSNF